jgi:deoxycytidylate deaminase
MINSLNSRRGADNKKTVYTDKPIPEYRAMKNEIKKKFDNSKIMTSKYFEHFDETDTKKTSNRQKYYLDLAAEIALNSNMLQKHGAILVYKKQVIASGYNYYLNTYSIHAEIAAICELKGKEKDLLPECDLYVVRIGPDKYNNPLKYSKPCFNCQYCINKHAIRKTYYSTNYEYDTMRSN